MLSAWEAGGVQIAAYQNAFLQNLKKGKASAAKNKAVPPIPRPFREGPG